MKTLLALLFLTVTTFAADDLKTAKTVDVSAVIATPAAYEGKVVKLKFGWRDGTKLAFWDGDKSRKITAIVPPEGAAWFNGLTTTTFATKGLFVFARVTEGKAELLGRELKIAADGATAVW